MVGIYFKTTRLPVRYLIYVAITALGRVLIEIVGAEHRTGMDILFIRISLHRADIAAGSAACSGGNVHSDVQMISSF